MFTGIIEALGELKNKTPHGTGIELEFSCPFVAELKIDQSIAHNGVCLTVTKIKDHTYSVVAIQETLSRSNLGELEPGDFVNLERCVRVGDRLDGHMVQGHVDTTAICKAAASNDGSWLFTFEHKKAPEFLTVDKGSIAVNGISLTVFDTTPTSFRVAIIPYTYEHTNLHAIKKGDSVNIEFDITGKYVQKLLNH